MSVITTLRKTLDRINPVGLLMTFCTLAGPIVPRDLTALSYLSSRWKKCADLDAVDADIAASMVLGRIGKLHLTAQNHGLRALCYQLGLIPDAPVHPNARPRTPAQRASAVPQPRIREVLARYLSTVDTVLRPKTVIARADNVTGFTRWLARAHPRSAASPS
jgi:hypothetical protein